MVKLLNSLLQDLAAEAAELNTSTNVDRLVSDFLNVYTTEEEIAMFADTGAENTVYMQIQSGYCQTMLMQVFNQPWNEESR